MKIKWVGFAFIAVILLGVPLMADSVYFWTDENGVRHYSNTGIPSGVQEAVERPEEFSAPSTATADEDSEPGADRDTPPESAPGEDAEEVAPSPDGEEETDPRLEARVEKERQRLEAEIKRIKGLSIGKSFTQGMKDAQIRPLEEQLALLNADPRRYFRMKREGAFGNASGTTTPAGPGPADGGPLSDSLESFQGSSASGQSGTSEPAPSQPPPEAQDADQVAPEGDASGGSRVSEPGADLRLPDENNGG